MSRVTVPQLLDAGARGKPFLRWLFRIPVGVYQRGWGWVFGHQFLLLVHRGRKTGAAHQTAQNRGIRVH